MAAASEPGVAEIVDLRQVSAAQLDHLLEREIRDWREELEWDFTASADLVRRYAVIRALSGYALLAEGKPAGYSYFVCEERKGLIGDLYVVEEHRTVDNENRLLAAVLGDLTGTPHLQRIESQLMMLRAGLSRPLPRPEFLRRYARRYMAIRTGRAMRLPPRPAAGRVFLAEWGEQRQGAAAKLIAAAYKGHIDADINDQYRSLAGARRFLTNIVQYPGCGTFFQPASWVAVDAASGDLCGLCLTSLLAADVGHITQICVAPRLQGKGVGYELLRRSLVSLAEAGCHKVSLTVSSANGQAVRLYESVGFETARTFAALVWEGW